MHSWYILHCKLQVHTGNQFCTIQNQSRALGSPLFIIYFLSIFQSGCERPFSFYLTYNCIAPVSSISINMNWNKLILLNTHFKDNILHSAPLRLYYLYSSSFWTILLRSTWSLIHCVTLRVCPDWFQLWWLLPFGLVIVVLVPLLAIVTLWSHRSCLFPKLVLLTSGCWVGPIG